VPGSTPFSDMTTPISIVKRKLKTILLETQKQSQDDSHVNKWSMCNFLHPSHSC
jgi:hypothetical protein